MFEKLGTIKSYLQTGSWARQNPSLLRIYDLRTGAHLLQPRQSWTPGYLNEACCCCSVAKLCLTLCDPMDCSKPGFSVLHYIPEFAQMDIESVMLSNHLTLCRLLSKGLSRESNGDPEDNVPLQPGEGLGAPSLLLDAEKGILLMKYWWPLPVVSNFFGTRDLCCGRQFFHGWELCRWMVSG